MNERPSMSIWLEKRLKCLCLLDIGAKINVISSSIINKLNMLDKINECAIQVTCANESSLIILGTIMIEITISSMVRIIKFYVAEKISPEIIAGVEMMTDFNIGLDMKVMNSHINSMDNGIDLQIKQLMDKFPEIFMKHKWDIGKTGLTKHRIITTGGPVTINPRRQPVHIEGKIDEMLQDMEKAGVIRKCESIWNSPLVCIVKKNKADIRICLDFRALNAITERPRFPIPNIEEMMDILNGSEIFSTVDLGNAYYQVELEEESQIKTAFSTKKGQFCFNRMPFGIAAAPATFQKMMTQVLGPLNWKEAIVYLDDILIFAKDEKEHKERLEKVFQRIKEAGLKISQEKCHFKKKEIKFLGHIINKNGIRTDNEKIRAMQEFEKPKCVKRLRSFLGLTNYYRKFVKDYAKHARVLENLCGASKEKLKWSVECEASFKNLKSQLMSTPILGFPDLTRDFILDTDASFDTIGAVLSQVDENGRERVIAYGSKAMNKHEIGYCITRKELLAIYHFTQSFKHYLYGKRFTLRTDHKAITFMIKTKKPITAQFQNWLNYLSGLDIKIEYRKGELHGNADALSRTDCRSCSQCQTIHEDAKTEKNKTKILMIHDVNKDEAMKKENEDVGTLINDLHKELCHVGARKVWEYLKKNIRMDINESAVRRVIEKCEKCQRRKSWTGKTKEAIMKQSTNEIFKEIFIDFCGPFKKSLSGKQYILAIIDQFSKYISLTAIAHQDEITTAKVLKDKWILKFGAPEVLHSDRGRVFESHVIRELLSKHHIKLKQSSPYHHNTNGLVERQFRTIRDAIATSIQDKKYRDWADLLPDIEFMINATIQQTTKYSPAEVVFGRTINKEWKSDNMIEDNIGESETEVTRDKNRRYIRNQIRN